MLDSTTPDKKVMADDILPTEHKETAEMQHASVVLSTREPYGPAGYVSIYLNRDSMN
jgi:hypothetical protein